MLNSYKKISCGCEVSVVPEFLEERSLPEDYQFVWRYTITITNQGKLPIQLMERHWFIVNARGERTEVQGSGVTGEQPVISVGDSYTYVSGCPLNTASGLMYGTYKMVGNDGDTHTVEIPAFALDSPYAERILN